MSITLYPRPTWIKAVAANWRGLRYRLRPGRRKHGPALCFRSQRLGLIAWLTAGWLLGGWLAGGLVHGQARRPAFARYPAEAPYRGVPAAPRLMPGTVAWGFRTRIREAARQPANFAGHYVLASWGCGAECLSFAVIDLKTGVVYFDNQTVCCWGTAVPDDFEPVYGRLASRLLVLTGLLNEAGLSGAHYFTFDHGRLLPVR